jgi:hypothetical protein
MNSKIKVSSYTDQKHIIVLTDGGIYWFLWSIDYIEGLLELGVDVVIVDLSAVSTKVGSKRIFKKLRTLYRKNDIKRIVSSLKDRNGVEIYTPKFKTRDARRYQKAHLNNYIDFRNGLDAEYFEEVGQRIMQEGLLKKKVLRRAKAIFDFTHGELLEIARYEKVSHLVVCGGRTLIPAASIVAGINAGIECSILESNDRGYLGYFNHPKDFRKNSIQMQEIILRNWNSADHTRTQIAQEFLNNKLFKQNSKGINFAVNFVRNELVDELSEIPYVVFFLTSGFEFMSFPEKKQVGDNGRIDQMEKVKEFCSIATDYGYRTIVRGHPQRSGHEKLSAIDDPEMAQLCEEIGATYVSTKDKTSSYDLMKNSKLNAVYMSSAAIDSMLLGSQTVILGNAEFAHLVPELCAFNESAIRARFDHLDRQIEIHKIFPYAFHLETIGKELENAWVSNEGNVFYKNQELNKVRFKWVGLLLRMIKTIQSLKN